MKNKKFIIVTSLVLLFILGFSALYFFGARYIFLLPEECGKDTIKEVSSLNGKYSASVVIVNCGATTDYATWITLKNSTNGNEETELTYKGDLSKTCVLNWDNEKTLNINCGASNILYQNQTPLDGITLSFFSSSTLN